MSRWDGGKSVLVAAEVECQLGLFDSSADNKTTGDTRTGTARARELDRTKGYGG